MSQLKVRRPQVRDNRVGTKTGERAGRRAQLWRPKARQRYQREPPHQKSLTRAKPRVARLVQTKA